MRENHLLVVPHVHFIFGETAPEGELDSEQRKERRAYTQTGNPLGTSGFTHRIAGVRERGHFLERLDTLPAEEEVGRAVRGTLHAGAGITVVDRYEAVRFVERKRLEKYRMDDAENGHVRTDANSQGQEHGRAERLLFDDALEAEAYISIQRFHGQLPSG